MDSGLLFFNYVPNLKKKKMSVLPESCLKLQSFNNLSPAPTSVEVFRERDLNRKICISAAKPFGTLSLENMKEFGFLFSSSKHYFDLKPHNCFPIFITPTLSLFSDLNKKLFDPRTSTVGYDNNAYPNCNFLNNTEQIKSNFNGCIPSLLQKSASTFALWTGGILKIEEALNLPGSVLRLIILNAFQIHWHVILHPDYDKEKTEFSPKSYVSKSYFADAFETIFNFLANPFIFRKLHFEDKRLLMHIVNFLHFREENSERLLLPTYEQRCCYHLTRELQNTSSYAAAEVLLHIGVTMAAFFCELSHHEGAELLARWVLHHAKLLLVKEAALHMRFEATAVLLRSLNAFNRYEITYKALFTDEVSQLFAELDNAGVVICRSSLHAEQALYHYAMSEYWKAYESCCLAALELSKQPHPRVVLQVLRVVCKLATLKRQYTFAMKIAQFAVAYAHDFFGDLCLPFATTLIEYGCVLLSADHTKPAKKVYKQAERIIRNLLPGKSVLLALAFEDLSYSTYVLEYSTGNFERGSKFAWTAVHHLRDMGHGDSLQCASVERVAALIMEEMALDTPPNNNKRLSRLQEAESLHQKSLKKCKEIFGEVNVQTAKHYGNLGRLYQSMHRMEAAEWNHLKAIEIKEKLLGHEDFEVALSLGHLASLYNYDMKKLNEAESLYLRSIDINSKLYGLAYSGLEYDYRGLIRVYSELGRPLEAARYQCIFEEWDELRVSREEAVLREMYIARHDMVQSRLQELLEEFQCSCVFVRPHGVAVDGASGVRISASGAAKIFSVRSCDNRQGGSAGPAD